MKPSSHFEPATNHTVLGLFNRAYQINVTLRNIFKMTVARYLPKYPILVGIFVSPSIAFGVDRERGVIR